MTNHFQIWYGIPLVLAVIVAGCGSSSPPPDSTPAVDPAPPEEQPSTCGTGLAAVDLAGHCRANPPTLGALEAVSG